MYVGVYNVSDAPLTVQMVFEGNGPGKRWTTTLTLPPNGRDAVPVQNVVPVKNGTFENFGTQVVFPAGRVGIVSFALWHDPNYGKDRVVDLSPTFLCKTPL